MITYVYTAKNAESGEMVKAEVQADSEQAAAKLLMGQKLFPIVIVPKGEEGFGSKLKLGNRIRTKDRVIFTRQLATLINAGLPLIQSLRTVQEQITNKALQKIVGQVISSVEGGSTLANAFAQFPDVFNQIFISLVAAGEASGSLDKTLERIAAQQEKDAELASKIRGALIYPVIILVVIVAVMVFMLTTVLPQIGQLYKDLKKDLPPLTVGLIALSNFLVHYWWLALIMLVGGVFGLRNFFKTETGGEFVDRFKLSVPLFGRIFKKVYMARFSRTLGTLLASGIPMLEALEIVRNVLNNRILERAMERAIGQVRGGKALSGALEAEPTFLVLVPQMIRIGEQSGAIDQMLTRVAGFYEAEVDEEVKNISTTIEPALMVILGVVVALIIASILLPVYSLVGQGISQ
jgi:type IV pilus assembly protein PilC